MPADLATLLPPGSTAIEYALEGSVGARIAALDPAAIARAKDPWTCPEEVLHFLAFEHSVDVWDDAWPAWKKRSVIATALRDHRLKGTEAGLRRFVEIADAELVQTATPPQGFFASPDLTKAQWDELLAKHPRVRITYARGRGQYEAPDGVFAGQAAADQACASPDHGRALIGRRAWLVQGETATPLQLSTIERSTTRRAATVIERVSLPGKTANSVVAGGTFAGDAFVDAWDQAPRFYSYALSRDYIHEESRLSITTVPLGFEPRDIRFRRESDRGSRDHAWFVGDPVGAYAATTDRGGELLADVLHLHDPAIAAPQVAGLSFVGHARVGMPHHQAEALVDWRQKVQPGSAIFANVAFAGHAPAAPEDPSRRAFLLRAIAASSRATDRVQVTFQTRRERTLGDGLRLNAAARLGSSIANHL
jgi:phage tail P2-like protein